MYVYRENYESKDIYVEEVESVQILSIILADKHVYLL